LKDLKEIQVDGMVVIEEMGDMGEIEEEEEVIKETITEDVIINMVIEAFNMVIEDVKENSQTHLILNLEIIKSQEEEVIDQTKGKDTQDRETQDINNLHHLHLVEVIDNTLQEGQEESIHEFDFN